MKKFLLTTVLLLLSTLVFSQERIAVFPFEDMDNLLTKNESVFFYRQFSNEFTNKNAGRFTIVPRQDVEKLFNAEEKFQLSDLSAKAKTAETQRVLNGTRILSGIIGKVGNRITISVSLYTFPELSQLPGGVDKRVANKDALFDLIPELVKEMQNNILGKIYKIGDIGPAGGYIFYDKGNYTDNWRYLEAAPDYTEWREIEHGGRGYVWNDEETDIGSGKEKTKEILIEDEYREKTAAKLCDGLIVNGFKDWFLPSIEELNLMYINLRRKGRGNFALVWYWSSTGNGKAAGAPYYLNFSEGTIRDYFDFKGNVTGNVRAIRAF